MESQSKNNADILMSSNNTTEHIEPYFLFLNGEKFRYSKHGAYDFYLPVRYEAKELIGYGSFGAVVEANDFSCKRVVAIKKIQNVSDHVDLKRVIREIVILKNLKHDNVIQLYDVIFVKK